MIATTKFLAALVVSITVTNFASALQAAGELGDSGAGRRSYQSYLEWQTVEGPAVKTRAYVNLSRGRALGSREFKAALVEEQGAEATARA